MTYFYYVKQNLYLLLVLVFSCGAPHYVLIFSGFGCHSTMPDFIAFANNNLQFVITTIITYVFLGAYFQLKVPDRIF